MKCIFCTSMLDARKVTDIIIDLGDKILPAKIATLYQCQNPECNQIFTR